MQALRESLLADDPANASGGALDRMPRIEAIGAPGRDRPPGGRTARRLRTAAAARCGRHGRGLAGEPCRWRVRAPGGAQDPAPARHAGRDGRTLRARMPHPRHARNPEHRSPVRCRRRCHRRALHRDGVRAGRAAGGLVRCPRARYTGAHPAVHPGAGRGELRAPAPDPASRPEAVEHPRHRTGRGAPAGFRRGAAAARGCGWVLAHAGLGPRADARLCEPGAAAWRAGRSAQRHLLAGRGAA